MCEKACLRKTHSNLCVRQTCANRFGSAQEAGAIDYKLVWQACANSNECVQKLPFAQTSFIYIITVAHIIRCSPNALVANRFGSLSARALKFVQMRYLLSLFHCVETCLVLPMAELMQPKLCRGTIWHVKLRLKTRQVHFAMFRSSCWAWQGSMKFNSLCRASCSPVAVDMP